MLAKRFLTAVFAFALILPLAGCRNNRCCKSSSISSAPPCCPTTGALPPSVLPPGY